MRKIIDHTQQAMGKESADVFRAHLEIVSDPEFIGEVNSEIKESKVNAEAALQVVTDKYVNMFKTMTDNAYMQERATDISDVMERVLSHLLHVALPDPSLVDQNVVVVAHDLTPSDAVQLNKKFVSGIITDVGGRTSHSAIMSRTLEIPAVVGTEKATAEISDGQMVIVDGLDGVGVIDPTEAELAEYKKRQAEFL